MAPPPHRNSRTHRRRSASLLAAMTAIAVVGAPAGALANSGPDAPAVDPASPDSLALSAAAPGPALASAPEATPAPAPEPAPGEDVPADPEAQPVAAPVPAEPEPEPVIVVPQEAAPADALAVTAPPALAGPVPVADPAPAGPPALGPVVPADPVSTPAQALPLGLDSVTAGIGSQPTKDAPEAAGPTQAPSPVGIDPRPEDQGTDPSEILVPASPPGLPPEYGDSSLLAAAAPPALGVDPGSVAPSSPSDPAVPGDPGVTIAGDPAAAAATTPLTPAEQLAALPVDTITVAALGPAPHRRRSPAGHDATAPDPTAPSQVREAVLPVLLSHGVKVTVAAARIHGVRHSVVPGAVGKVGKNVKKKAEEVGRSPWLPVGLLAIGLLYLLGQRAMDRGSKLSYAGRTGAPDDELIEL